MSCPLSYTLGSQQVAFGGVGGGGMYGGGFGVKSSRSSFFGGGMSHTLTLSCVAGGGGMCGRFLFPVLSIAMDGRGVVGVLERLHYFEPVLGLYCTHGEV